MPTSAKSKLKSIERVCEDGSEVHLYSTWVSHPSFLILVLSLVSSAVLTVVAEENFPHNFAINPTSVAC